MYFIILQETSNIDENEEDDDDDNSSPTSEAPGEQNRDLPTPVRLLGKKKRITGPDSVITEAANVLSDLKSRKVVEQTTCTT